MRYLILTLALPLGCAPSLDVALDDASGAYCDRAEECGWYEGEEGREDCEELVHDFMETLWPEDDCEEQINREEWHECLDGMAEIDCSTWDLGLTDIAKYCEPDDVCED